VRRLSKISLYGTETAISSVSSLPSCYRVSNLNKSRLDLKKEDDGYDYYNGPNCGDSSVVLVKK
jgi:hypothetical protein